MKSVKCSDLGAPECPFVAEGETNEEVKQKLYEHAGVVHPEKMKEMTEEDKKQMDAKIDELIG